MKRVLFGVFLVFAVSAMASAQSFTYYFPQVAAGGGWRKGPRRGRPPYHLARRKHWHTWGT